MTSNTKFVSISFDVVGSFTQNVAIINPDITPEQLVENLNSGEFMTTLEVTNDGSEKRTIVSFDEQGNDVDVAIILDQTGGEENVYSRFQLEE